MNSIDLFILSHLMSESFSSSRIAVAISTWSDNSKCRYICIFWWSHSYSFKNYKKSAVTSRTKVVENMQGRLLHTRAVMLLSLIRTSCIILTNLYLRNFNRTPFYGIGRIMRHFLSFKRSRHQLDMYNSPTPWYLRQLRQTKTHNLRRTGNRILPLRALLSWAIWVSSNWFPVLTITGQAKVKDRFWLKYVFTLVNISNNAVVSDWLLKLSRVRSELTLKLVTETSESCKNLYGCRLSSCE